MRRTYLWIALAFSAFWVVYLSMFAPRQRAVLENSAMIEPADYDWSALDLNDQPVSFAKFKGKTIFLNIWATWCGPCVGEMPSIAVLAKKMKAREKPIEFVCISTDNSTETVRQFLKGRDWSMTFLRAEQLPRVFLTEGIPATFVIASDGRIAASEIGAVDWDDPKVAAFIEKLVAGTPAPPTK